ncbi:Erg28-like protein [Neoconidiobolus thromboides FSU 785]|nr:Erg28-like protein [Neoconidiobolus thromboides FSU 785]
MVLLSIASGLLPKWQLIVSVAALFNSAQCFISPFKFNHEIYSGNKQQVTELSSRLFGTWTLISGLIRLYSAFYINNQHVYSLCLLTYLLAFFHFSTELFIYKTVKLNRASISPFIVSSFSILWMGTAYSSYVH